MFGTDAIEIEIEMRLWAASAKSVTKTIRRRDRADCEHLYATTDSELSRQRMRAST